MDDSMDSDPPASPRSSGGYLASSWGGKPVIGPGTRPPSPPETPLETRLMIAALASGKLQPTPEVLEKLRLHEEEGLRRDNEKLAWMRARDEASARVEAAGGWGLRERTMPYDYDYECDREAFQDYARISRRRARREASSSAAAAGGFGLHERTMPYEREAFQDYATISRLQGQKDAISGTVAGRSGLGELGGLD
uniref:Uncharacterized protein n=1 Tax=Arundo donax TaxID=35708 RepID=A0A0A9CUM7_ARUDO